MIKTFRIPTFALSHSSLVLRRSADDAAAKLLEYTFELYVLGGEHGLAGIMADPWWLGQGAANQNETPARVDASLRIQDAYEAAKSGDGMVRIEDADLAWLVDRARAFQLPQALSVLAPKLAKFYRVLLSAQPEQSKTNGASAHEERVTS